MPIRVTSRRAAPAPQQALSYGLPQPPAGFVQKPAGLTLCMIVKNEERFLEQCLRSVGNVADEICIVDTGSSDRTVAIAHGFGARVEHRQWRSDFAWARNEAISMASRRWILMLDADEELKPESIPVLETLKNVPAHTTGVWIRCYNRSDDYRGTGEMSHALVRIFPNNERIRFRGLIHEFVTLDESASGLNAVNAPVAVIHHGYLTEVVKQRDKAKRNFEIVQAAAKKDPSDPFVWFNLGTTAFMMKDFEAARDALEHMRALNGDETRGFIANGYSILAETYCDKLGDPKKGEEIAFGALRFSPRYANAHFQLGKALVAQQRYEQAREAFLEAIADGAFVHQQFVVDDQVSIWKAHSEIGSSYVIQGDDAAAVEWFRKGLANAPKVQPLMLNLARALERLGQFTEAGALFRHVYEEFGDDYGTIDYVNYLLRRKDGEAAIAIIDACHPSLSDDVAGQLLLAGAQLAASIKGKPEALRYLEAAADRAPGSAEILNWLEAEYREGGNDEALQRMLAREKAVEPRRAADYVRRSYRCSGEGDHEASLGLAEAGLALEPRNAYLHFNAAAAAASLHRTQTAFEHLDAITMDTPALHVDGMFLRATILHSLDRDDEALGAVEKILAVAPAHTGALRLKSSIAEARNDLVRAEDALASIAQTDGARGAVELAAFFLRQGRFEEAARVAENAIGR